jgi:hypothetical protein
MAPLGQTDPSLQNELKRTEQRTIIRGVVCSEAIDVD